MRSDLGRLAAASEDAFDAAISAVVMAAGVDELRTPRLGMRLRARSGSRVNLSRSGPAATRSTAPTGSSQLRWLLFFGRPQREARRRHHRQSRSSTYSTAEAD